jgi:transcriptional regulator with XRE-family HTH domain
VKLIDLDEKMRGFEVKNIDIAKDLSVTEKAVSQWRRGRVFPSDNAISYLLGKFGALKVETDSGEIFVMSENPTTPAPE